MNRTDPATMLQNLGYALNFEPSDQCWVPTHARSRSSNADPRSAMHPVPAAILGGEAPTSAINTGIRRVTQLEPLRRQQTRIAPLKLP